HGGTDESEMRECLREVAKLPPGTRIVLFREQADIVAQGEQALEQGVCFGVAMLQPVIVGKPEAAREKHAFSRRQAVNVCLGSITQHKAVDHEFPLNCRYSARHPWILGRQKANERDQQQTRIELAAAEALRESVALAVEPQLADRRVHAVAEFSP